MRKKSNEVISFHCRTFKLRRLSALSKKATESRFSSGCQPFLQSSWSLTWLENPHALSCLGHIHGVRGKQKPSSGKNSVSSVDLARFLSLAASCHRSVKIFPITRASSTFDHFLACLRLQIKFGLENCRFKPINKSAVSNSECNK